MHRLQFRMSRSPHKCHGGLLETELASSVSTLIQIASPILTPTFEMSQMAISQGGTTRVQVATADTLRPLTVLELRGISPVLSCLVHERFSRNECRYFVDLSLRLPSCLRMRGKRSIRSSSALLARLCHPRPDILYINNHCLFGGILHPYNRSKTVRCTASCIVGPTWHGWSHQATPGGRVCNSVSGSRSAPTFNHLLFLHT